MKQINILLALFVCKRRYVGNWFLPGTSWKIGQCRLQFWITLSQRGLPSIFAYLRFRPSSCPVWRLLSSACSIRICWNVIDMIWKWSVIIIVIGIIKVVVAIDPVCVLILMTLNSWSDGTNWFPVWTCTSIATVHHIIMRSITVDSCSFRHCDLVVHKRIHDKRVHHSSHLVKWLTRTCHWSWWRTVKKRCTTNEICNFSKKILLWKILCTESIMACVLCTNMYSVRFNEAVSFNSFCHKSHHQSHRHYLATVKKTKSAK